MELKPRNRRPNWLAACAVLLGMVAAPAMAQLTVTPITWDVVGLDSNAPLSGPKDFPVGARICRTGPAGNLAAGVTVALNLLDSGPVLNPPTPAPNYINLRLGTSGSYSVGAIPQGVGTGGVTWPIPSNCRDAYFEVTVNQTSAAFETWRRYTITATDGSISATSPQPRQLFVERLVSQARNDVASVRYRQVANLSAPTSLDPNDYLNVLTGGGAAFVVGGIYDVRLEANTATQGYEQIASFVNISNAVFRVSSVRTTYTAITPTLPANPRVQNPFNGLYGDACRWQPDPNSPAYRSCLADGKAGGTVVSIYRLAIIGVTPGPQALNALIYDFSGSSFHYNGDFSADTGSLTATSGLTKAFNPASIVASGTSTLSISIANNSNASAGLYTVEDDLPAGVVVAPTPAVSNNGNCGTPTVLAAAASTDVVATNITVPASSTCTITVAVTAAAAGLYTNTIPAADFLLNGTSVGGGSNSATLTVTSNVAALGCSGNTTLAQWNFNNLASGNNTGVFTPAASTVTAGISASAASGAGVRVATGNGSSPIIRSGGGLPSNAWSIDSGTLTTGNDPNGSLANARADNDYVEFSINTQGLTSLTFSFTHERTTNGATRLSVFQNVSGTSNPANDTGYVQLGADITVATGVATFSTDLLASLGQLNASGVTYFRIYAWQPGNQTTGQYVDLDNVTFLGCGPVTISKAFGPNSIPQSTTLANYSSTLTFLLSNPNTSQLTNVAFEDYLPAGVEVFGSANSSGCGTPIITASNTAPLGPRVIMTGGTIAAATPPNAATCQVTVPVRATAAGSFLNVSGPVSSTQTGSNTSPSGRATATLTAIAPPTITKAFAPAQILSGGTSRVRLTIVNPNPTTAITGVAITDLMPAGVTVLSTPPWTGTGCDFSTTPTPIATNSPSPRVGITNGSIAAGGTCVVEATVTSTITAPPSVQTFTNTIAAGDLTHTMTVNGSPTAVGSPSTATADLVVRTPQPGIALSKQVRSCTLNIAGDLGSGCASVGPWVDYLAIPLSSGIAVQYRFTIENTGDVPLVSPTVVDPQIVGEEACVWTNPLPVADINDDDHIDECIVGPIQAQLAGVVNTATASFSGATPQQQSTDTAEYRVTSLRVVKSANRLSYTGSGPTQTISYTITVTNTGSATLSGFNFGLSPQIVDPIDPAATCQSISQAVQTSPAGPGNGDNFFNPGEQLTCTATYTPTVDDVNNARTITNTATVQFAEISAQSNTVNVFYLAANTPLLVVAKSISDNPQPGLAATFTIVVTNAGSAATGTSPPVTMVDVLPVTTRVAAPGPSGTGWNCSTTVVGTAPNERDRIECVYDNPVPGSIAAGQPAPPITIPVTVAITAESINNTAFVTGGGDPVCNSSLAGIPDPALINDRCEGTVNVTTVPVTLSDVASSVENGQLVVRFGTALEAGTLGFRVLTSNSATSSRDQRMPLNAGILRARGSTLLPQRYEARGPFNGQTQVWIEEITVRNKANVYGPFPVGVLSGERDVTVETDWAGIQVEQASFRVAQRNRLMGRLRGGGLEGEIAVDRDGWVVIRHEDLVAQGIDWTGLPAGALQVSWVGGLMPIRYEGPASFGPGSRFAFLGRAIKDDLYTRTQVYRVRMDAAPSQAIATVDARPDTLRTFGAARDTHTYAPDAHYDFASPADDPWFAFDVVRINQPVAAVSRTISLPHRSPGSSNERIVVDLYGGLDFIETPDHSVRIKVNGTTVATRQFDGITRQQVAADLPAGVLQTGDNTVTVELVGDTGVYADIVLVNAIRIEYARTLVALDNRVDFTVQDGPPAEPAVGDALFASSFEEGTTAACFEGQAGCTAWRVTGLTTNDVIVLRERTNGVTQELVGGEFTQVGAGYELRFAAIAAAGDRFVVEPRAGVGQVPVAPAAPRQDPISGAMGEYLIISHPSFIDGLAPLVAARQAEGFTVRVVDVEDIYRWYTHGVFGADAVSIAIANAHARIGTRYVLLVGADTYDYFNFEGSNSMSFVPTHYRQSDWLVRYAPTDSVHADVDRDGRSDVAIGRFPVRTRAELDAVIAKTLAYGAADHPRNVLRIADRDDGGTNFRRMTDPIASALDGWNVTTVGLQDYPVGNTGTQQARQAIVAAINGGQALMTYFGHSAPNSWTREGLVTAQLVYDGLFNNAARPTVAWQLGCWGAYFVDPYFNTIAHGMLLQPNGGGAAAVIGASALTEAGNDMAWMNMLTPRLRGQRIGDALRDSQRLMYSMGPGSRDIAIGGTLLGDPALRIRQ